MRNSCKHRGLFAVLVLFSLVSSAVFGEDYVCSSLTIENGSGQIQVINNTLEYVRVRGTPGAIRPRNSGYVPFGCILDCNVNVDYVVTRGRNGSITCITVNSLGGTSGGSANNNVDVHCITCHGSGKCPKCNGRKTIASGRNQVKCDRCNGSGICPYCHGTGRK